MILLNLQEWVFHPLTQSPEMITSMERTRIEWERCGTKTPLCIHDSSSKYVWTQYDNAHFSQVTSLQQPAAAGPCPELDEAVAKAKAALQSLKEKYAKVKVCAVFNFGRTCYLDCVHVRLAPHLIFPIQAESAGDKTEAPGETKAKEVDCDKEGPDRKVLPCSFIAACSAVSFCQANNLCNRKRLKQLAICCVYWH